MGHGAAAFLSLCERFFHLANFGALQVANFHGQFFDGATAHGEGRYEGRVAISLKNLGGHFGGFQAQVAADAFLEIGSGVGVGAYGATESMPFFLSHPIPPEIAIRDGEAWVARPRIEPEAWLDGQVAEPARSPRPRPTG